MLGEDFCNLCREVSQVVVTSSETCEVFITANFSAQLRLKPDLRGHSYPRILRPGALSKRRTLEHFDR